MRRKKLLWRIYLSFFACAMCAFVFITWYSIFALRQFHQEQTGQDLLVRARIIANEIEGAPADISAEKIVRLCQDLGRLTQTRITVILSDGRVIGDSEENPAAMENHKGRPEIAAVLKGHIGKSVRFSATIRRTMMYLAIPVRGHGDIVAVVRTSLPLSVIDWAPRALYRHMLLGGAMMAVLFAVITLVILRRISRPLEEMREVAEKLARGELNARVPESGYDETEALARALNQMATQLGERMRIIMEQRNERDALFVSMAEGLLAVDKDERVLHLNPAAARWLNLEPEKARDKSIQETIRNPDLQKFIGGLLRRNPDHPDLKRVGMHRDEDDTLAQTGVLDDEIVIYGNKDRFLQLHGTVLKDAAGMNIGALVVFNDITRLKRLETIRRDFVANVSHELKTPITALKGCAETLAYGSSITDQERKKFNDMLVRHVTRLEAIVDDLLSLSQVEFDTERDRIQLEPGSICAVLKRAAQNYTEQAKQKKITVEVVCPENLTASINAALLEQAVGNLIDNAVKYSGEGTRVILSAKTTDGEVEISVADFGMGIEKKHLDRIFERFYRVDQARSRALGGTGLGLSIVKHIALAHRGTVGVTSGPGQGSTFTICLPL